MAIKIAQVSIENIDDTEGLESVMTALKNITGVTEIELSLKMVLPSFVMMIRKRPSMLSLRQSVWSITSLSRFLSMPRKIHVIMISGEALIKKMHFHKAVS